jgi:transcriptional regulator with XRE-family HTH domain
MNETHQLVDALKRCVKSRGLTYRALAGRINLSEASVKRIFAQRNFTIRRLEQICKALDMSVTELLRMIDRSASAVTMLSLGQESALARDPALLSYFYLIVNGWTDGQIRREYEFEESQIAQLRDRLVALELIESLPRRRYRLRVSRRLVWRPDGPVRRAYARQVQTEFLHAGFAGRGEFLGWQPAELTESSIGVLERKLERLYEEFLQMAEFDALGAQPRHSTALLVAFRPWVFSLVAARRRRPSARGAAAAGQSRKFASS